MLPHTQQIKPLDKWHRTCGQVGLISLAWLDGCPNYRSQRLQEAAAKSAHVQGAVCKAETHALI